jgi:hypothetical protein
VLYIRNCRLLVIFLGKKTGQNIFDSVFLCENFVAQPDFVVGFLHNVPDKQNATFLCPPACGSFII